MIRLFLLLLLLLFPLRFCAASFSPLHLPARTVPLPLPLILVLLFASPLLSISFNSSWNFWSASQRISIKTKKWWCFFFASSSSLSLCAAPLRHTSMATQKSTKKRQSLMKFKSSECSFRPYWIQLNFGIKCYTVRLVCTPCVTLESTWTWTNGSRIFWAHELSMERGEPHESINRKSIDERVRNTM